jgi:hypothetical protein
MDGNPRLELLIAALDAHIETVRVAGLAHAGALLAMAKLELQMHVHGITDAELRALSEAITARPAPTAETDIIDLATRRPRERAKS